MVRIKFDRMVRHLFLGQDREVEFLEPEDVDTTIKLRKAKRSQNLQHQSKGQYDRRIRSSVLQPRNRVLVRNLYATGGPGTL